MVEFYSNPGTLDELPTVYYGAARVQTPQIASLQRDSYSNAFPRSRSSMLPTSGSRPGSRGPDCPRHSMSRRSRFFAGAIILASSVAGTRFRRIREIVIFKTSGRLGPLSRDVLVSSSSCFESWPARWEAYARRSSRACC